MAKRKPDSGIASIFVQMGLIVAGIVVCATLIWGDFGKEEPGTNLSKPPAESTGPAVINTSPVETLPPQHRRHVTQEHHRGCRWLGARHHHRGYGSLLPRPDEGVEVRVPQ